MEKPAPPVVFTPEDLARRKRRSIAMAIILAIVAVLFFVSTLVRLGGNIAERAM
jgi:accessory gene regulator protein AgrB